MYTVFHLSQGKWRVGGTSTAVATCLGAVTEDVALMPEV